MNPPRPEVALAAALVAAVAVVAGPDAPMALRVLGGAAVLLLPGYAWSRALLPAEHVGGAERVLSTIALAVAHVITGTLLLYPTPWRLTTRSWAIASAVGGIIAISVWARRSPSRRLQAPWAGWAAPRGRDVVLVALAVVVLGATAALAFRPLSPPRGVTGYTELSLVPAGDHLTLTVACFELQSTRYRIDLVGDGTVVQTWDNVQLGSSQSWTQLVAPPGSFIEARLYRSEDTSTTPYRIVHLRLATPMTSTR